MAHVNEQKKKIIKEFQDLIKNYPIIGAVNMQGLATPQVQRMRAKLRDTVVIKMTKRRLLNIALEGMEKDKKGISKLKDYLQGMPAMIFTKDNPFILFKTIQKNKSTARAKAGQIAPSDIKVKAGATSFAPGPVISEFGSIGLKTGIENGKVAIKADAVVVKEGNEISAKVAEVLGKLGVEPMEIGLDLTAVYEDGSIFDKNVLAIDEKEYFDQISLAHKYAFNLAFETDFPVREVVELKIVKAANESMNLAVEAGIYNQDSVERILSMAQCQAMGLKSTVNV
ncbi:50S ribosomal protein L10 [Candidatus Woesearchaeota archaeon]|nr:50S ribosomal protein L10 [Candidatus Woesearchaeota archaeon]